MKMKLRYCTLSLQLGILISLCSLFSACTEIEYTEIDNPAYLRVFNSLNYEVKLENRLERPPFLTMLIDPVFDEEGIPVSAAIVSDFLDQRDKYAAPFPTHSAGSTSKKNPEYPGKENVLVGPILNGFDLSSWAQVPSGKHRIVFMFRPINEIPFFSLEKRLKKDVAIDENIDLQAKEIYTLNVLQKDYMTKENGIILRQENFHKLPLSDSLVYFNMYNYSAYGFQSSLEGKDGSNTTGSLHYGILDNMNVYLSLYPTVSNDIYGGGYDSKTAIKNYDGLFISSLVRNTESNGVAAYSSFPLYRGPSSNGIKTDMIQFISLIAPGLSYAQNPYGRRDAQKGGEFALLTFHKDGVDALRQIASAYFPNMIISLHSGEYNPRSFSTVNTIEIVNGKAYLTTIQRKYAPPVYK